MPKNKGQHKIELDVKVGSSYSTAAERAYLKSHGQIKSMILVLIRGQMKTDTAVPKTQPSTSLTRLQRSICKATNFRHREPRIRCGNIRPDP